MIKVKSAMEVARWYTVAGVLQPPATRALVRPFSVTKVWGVWCSDRSRWPARMRNTNPPEPCEPTPGRIVVRVWRRGLACGRLRPWWTAAVALASDTCMISTTTRMNHSPALLGSFPREGSVFSEHVVRFHGLVGWRHATDRTMPENALSALCSQR